MMFLSTTRCLYLLAGLLMLMSAMFKTADAVSEFRKSPVIELGNVYGSNNTVLTSLVVSNGHCGLICDELGDDQCQSFNVKPEGNQIRCELFDHQPREVASIVPHPTGQLFEEECEALRVTASAKGITKGLDFAILIDDNRNVYRLSPAFPQPRMIGPLEEVFLDFHQRIDDILFFENIYPFGAAFFIRYGALVYCYKALDENHTNFKSCDKNGFPVHVNEVTSGWFADYRQLKLMMNSASHFVTVTDDVVVRSMYDFNGDASVSVQIKFRGAQYYYCHLMENFEFCSLYQRFWLAASSAIFLNGEHVGLFVGTKMYTFDFGKNIIYDRYPVCQNKNLLFIFKDYP